MSKVGLKRHFKGRLPVRYLIFVMGMLFSGAAFAQPTFTTTVLDGGTYGTPYLSNTIETSYGGDLEITSLDLPAWLTLTDNTDGTATLSGTPPSVQTYTFTITATDPNDALQTVSQQFEVVVEKAILTATAQNDTRMYGHPDPTFSIAYSGFKFSDGPGVLNTPPTVPATNGSAPVGVGVTVFPANGSDDHYTFSYGSGILTITLAPLTITAASFTKVYGDANPAFNIIYSGFRNGENVSHLTNPPTLGTGGFSTSTNAGSHTITVSGATSSNYSITHTNGTLTVNKAQLTIKANDLTRLYGGSEAITLNYTGFVNSETATVLDNQPAPTVFGPTTSVGGHTIFVTAGPDNNYSFIFQTGTLTVNKAPLTVKANDLTRLYGGADAFTFTYTGFVNGETAAVLDGAGPQGASPAGAATPVGTHTITVSAATLDDNYAYTFQTGVLTVNKAPLTVKANDLTRLYGGADAFTFTYTGFVNGETSAVLEFPGPVGASPSGTATPVGTHTITVSAPTPDDNYAYTFQTGTLTVNKAPLTVKANDLTRLYGAADAFTFTYTGFVNGETSAVLEFPGPVGASPAGTATPVGTHTITVSAPTPDDNYAYTFQTGTLTVNKAPLTVKANDLTRLYGAADAFTFTYTGFVNGETAAVLDAPGPQGASPAGTATPVGTHTITVSAPTPDNNYAYTFQTGTLTVNKAPLTVKANDLTRLYGGADAFTFTYTGFVNGETSAVLEFPGPVGASPSGAATNVGTHTITVSAPTPDDNYAYTFQTGILTVNKAPLTVKAVDYSRVYGTTTVATLSYTGFVNGETAAVLDAPGAAPTVFAAGTPVGTHTINVTALNPDNNYAYVFQTGVLTVTPAALTATAQDKTRVYGLANPTLTIAYTGFVNGDGPGSITQPTIGVVAPPDASVGGHPITLTGGSAANYTLNLVNGTLTITPAGLTISVVSTSKTYGDVNPALSVTYSGFAAGDTYDKPGVLTTPVHIETTALTESNIGSYPINASAAVAPNYTISYQQGTLTINRAVITATAQPATRNYGGTNPSFSIVYTGFVNGDGPGVVSGGTAAAPGALPQAVVGPYAIIPSGASADNYNFNYVNGTLTITKAPVIATAEPKSRTYGSPDPTFTATYSGFLFGQTDAVLTTALQGSSNSTSLSDVGNNYVITLSSAAAQNYSFTFVPGTLTITKATLIATAVAQTKVYGTANPTLTVSYSGFKNSQDANVLLDAPDATTAAGTDSHVGQYAINVAGGDDENYTFSYVSSLLTITKATLIATADNKSRVYGGANPSFTVSYNGLLGDDVPGEIDDAPDMATAAGPTAIVGIHPITISGGADNNYTFSYVPGNLEITKKMLTATPDDKFRIYGAANPPFTFTYSGFANGETATVIADPANGATAADANSPVDNYAIIGSDASDENYDFTYAMGVLHITKAPLILTAVNQSRPYGSANPTFTITYSGFQNSETPAVLDDPKPVASTDATILSPFGNYPINISVTTDNNYAITRNAGTLSITKALLTIKADNKTRPYNTVNPVFTLTYTGFLNGDNASMITPPNGTTSATQTFPVGDYPINLSGGSSTNYTFDLQSGILTITKANPVITWNNPSAITYPAPLSPTQLNASSSVPGTFNYTPASGTILNAGAGQTLTATFTPSDGINYNSITTGISATITVNKGTPLITWANPAAITYGTPLGTTNQLNASANVLGTFTYTPPATTVLNAGPNQTLRADFEPQDANNYNPVTNTTRQITVNQATPTVTWSNPPNITYGTPLALGAQLNAVFSVLGTPTYIPGPGTILATGANQALVVNFVPNDAVNYTSVNGTQVLITVVKANPTITWATPADITYPAPLTTGVAGQLNATANVSGAFTYSPVAGTILSAGTGQTLTASFAPSGADANNYNSVPSITRTINVNKGTPTVTWGAPTAITYGTALSGTQLNASASVAGTYAYTPALGTVLNAGNNQTLSVTFTPTDPNYNTVVRNTTISVNKQAPVVLWSNPATITYGTPLTLGSQLNATANVPGIFEYTPADGTILNTGSNQVLSVKFTPNDQANYSIVLSTTVQISVIKATPIVTWPTPLPIKTGVALVQSPTGQLNATASVPGSYLYTPAAGTSFAEGVHTLSVAFTPTDGTNYNSVPVTQVQLTVNSKDNPVITWNDPAAITYGTTLSGTQLNANAGGLPGTYAYSPPAGTLLNAGANQTLTVTFTPDDGVNYNTVVRMRQITVNKKTLTATAADASRSYGSVNPTFTINYSGFVGAQTAAVIDTPPTATCAAIAADPALSTSPIVPAGGTDNNYTFTYVNGTLTINKATLHATADAKTRTYGIANPAFTLSYTGFVNNDDVGDIVEPSTATPAVIGSNVGGYTITVGGTNPGSAANYNIVPHNGTLTVTKSPLFVIGNDHTKVYGDPNPTLTFRYVGFRNGDTETAIGTPPTVTTSVATMTGIGTYATTVSGGLSTNYQLDPFPGSLTVTKAPLTVKADNKTRDYGQSNPANTRSFTGFKGGDGPGSITLPTFTGPAANSLSDAGTYLIQLSGGSAANYDLTLQNGTLTVNKIILTAKADNKTKIYGDANPLFTITYTGFVNGDNASEITPPTPQTTATPLSSVAVYAITLTGGSATNYDFSRQSGTLTIDPASLVARPDDRTRPYGQANPTLTISYTGFLNNDTESNITPPIASTTAAPTSNVGTYPITLAGGTALNYTITRQSGTLTVAKATLNAEADDKTKVYGQANPGNSITYTGFVNGDDAGDITAPTISGPGTANNSPVGVYPITLSGGTGSNYTFVLANGALTITPAQLTAKAEDKSRLYGASNPPFTITYTGFISGENATNITQPTASTVAGGMSDVGTYPITLSGTTSNYAFVFVPGTLTVNKATVNVTAANKTKVYGTANPAFTVTYSGFLNSETASVIDTPPVPQSTATAASGVGTYAINVSGGLDNNYTFTYTSGNLNVTKAALTATADNKQRFFGDSNPPFTITYTGLVNGDLPTSFTQPTASTTAITSSPFGAYPIVLAGGVSANYNITLAAGTLSVLPALLTVTAVSQTRTYGATNPTLTVTYAGFVNGQTVADIDVAPTASTVATKASNVGSYPITVSGGVDSNYTFAYASGTLTVNKAVLNAIADPKASTYGTIPPLSISYFGFMNGDNATAIDTQPVASTTATATSGPTTYPINVTGGTDNNYALNNVASTLTIGKAPLTAKADDKARIIGLANPAFTITYSGFVNNETLDVIDRQPTALTIADATSPSGPYAINVAGGADDHYEFVYQPGTLTVIHDTPPVVKNFQVDAEEDKRFNFTAALFAANTTDEPNGKIVHVKLASLPVNGALFKGATRAVAGDEIAVTNGVLEEFYYVPNTNYSGSDVFSWNVFDGTFLAASNATVTIKVTPVNDPPSLSNVESTSLEYSLGDPAIPVTQEVIITDVDNNFMFSASILIAANFTDGDELSVEGLTDTKITSFYDRNSGELKLTGKETRAIYETTLRKVMFSSPVSGEATISEKNITLIVRDSIADSNIAGRAIRITEVFPELDIVNSFTPNGDDVNDFWDILNLDNYTEINISVYNQDGLKVFECHEVNCAWDGTLKGQPLPAGPYMYAIDLNAGKRKYKGTVTILK